MSAPKSDRRPGARSQRPKATTVFAAAFLAGAAAAVGLNRTLDVHLAQRKPRVESEPIFVALRSLPQGAPLTVWDVALRDWPKAMLPAAALRPRDSFDGMVLKHPIREGQPILSVQLVKVSTPGESQVAEAAAAPVTKAPAADATPNAQTDLWAPAEVPAPAIQPADSVSQTAPPSSEPETTVPETTTVAAAGDATATNAVPAEPTETPVEPRPVAPTEALAEDAPAAAISADAPPAETAVPAPVVAEPVIVATTAATDIDDVIAPVANATEAGVTPARETVMRYLVVPERIALEADRSFVPPAEPEQKGKAAGEAVAQTPATQSSSPAAQSQAQQGRTDRPATRTSANRDRQPQRPPRSAAGQSAPAKQPEKQSFLRSMMPSLSLGMGAVEPSPKSNAKPKTAAQPDSKPEQAPRSTVRGFGLFR